MRGPLDVEDRVAHLPAQGGKLLLELRLEVDVRRRRVLDPAGKGLDDRLLDVLETVLEEESRERRFQQRGKDVAIPREAVELVLGDAARAPRDQPRPEVELPSDNGAARARNDVRADLRQPALRQVRIAVVERPRNGELEDAVAEELEPLVRGRALGRPRRMGERIVDQLRREPFDQGRKSSGFPRLGAAVTGAT